MKAILNLTLGAFVGVLATQVLAFETSVTLNAAFNNVFNLNGDGTAGDYVYGETYTDLSRAQVIDIAAGSAKVGPNIGYYEDVCVNGDKNEFWCGANGSTPNKFVDLVASGAVVGQPQFTLTADVSGIPDGYSAKLTAIGFTADYGGNYAFPADTVLTDDGTLTATIDFTGGTLVNYQAQIILSGPIIAPDDKASVGYMNVTNLKATFADPTAPTSVQVTGDSDGSFFIRWAASTVPPREYVIQQKSSARDDASWVDVASVSWTKTSYAATTSLKEGDTTSFRVVAIGAGATATSDAVDTFVPAVGDGIPVPALPLSGLLGLIGLVGWLGLRRRG